MNKNTITRNGRTYTYSEVDDTYYPVPTEKEYKFQLAVIYVGLIVVCIWIAVNAIQ